MATAAITNAYRVDNYACFQLQINIDLNDAQIVTIAGVGSGWNGTYPVFIQSQWQLIGVSAQGELEFSDITAIPNQVIVYSPGDNSLLHAVIPNGTLTYTPNCTWITHTDLANWLGISYASDADFIDLCTAAANTFCFRRRQESGYLTDTPGTVPSQDVKLGTIMYGGAIYRARGAIDQFSSFSEMGTAPVVGMSPVIKQLLGNQRPQVA
jgi:hypothetical protein